MNHSWDQNRKEYSGFTCKHIILPETPPQSWNKYGILHMHVTVILEEEDLIPENSRDLELQFSTTWTPGGNYDLGVNIGHECKRDICQRGCNGCKKMEKHRSPLLAASAWQDSFGLRLVLPNQSPRLWQAYVLRRDGVIIGWRLFRKQLSFFIDVPRKTMVLHHYHSLNWRRTLREELVEMHGDEEDRKSALAIHLMYMAFGLTHDDKDSIIPWDPPHLLGTFDCNTYSIEILPFAVLHYGNSYAPI